MKKRIRILILLLVFATSAHSQIVGLYIKYYDLKSATKDLNRDIKKKEVKSGSVNYVNDTLITQAENNKENIILKLTFKKYEYFDQCEYQYMSFKCSECAITHLDEFLKDKSYEFKKISENKYVSKYNQQTELEVKQTPGEQICLTLIFKFIDKPKKEYKTWYNSL
jgi:hypothetical protein